MVILESHTNLMLRSTMESHRLHPSFPPVLILASVAAVGAACVMTQLALLRELLSAFCGNELIMGMLLGNWLLLSGIGAWLGRFAVRWRHAQAAFAFGQLLVAVLPLAQVVAVRVWRNEIFPTGAPPGIVPAALSSLVLLLPFCLVSGGLLILACGLLAGRDAAIAPGRVYGYDSLGSVLGGVVFSLVLIRWLDHFDLLCAPAFLNLALAAGLAWHGRHRWLARLAGSLMLLLVGLVVFVKVDAWSTARQFPGQHVVLRRNSPYGRLVVTESSGQYNFMENGVPVATSQDLERAEEAAHFAMVQRPDARRVLLVGGGISGTAREILKYGVREVTYVELDPLVLEAARRYLPGSLADERIRVIATDGRRFVRRADRIYDVVIIDLPDPTTSQVNRYYTVEFFQEVQRCLAKGGVVGLAIGRYENYVSAELARLVASTHRTLSAVFPRVQIWPGSRVSLAASDGPLADDIASRLEQRGIVTRWVNRHSLTALLTADRMADMERAVAVPAAINRDLNPVLYFYHLQYWLGQFPLRWGIGEAGLLLLLAGYLARLRAAPLAVFASGFTASALEVVLLLAYQVLHGLLYHRVGLLVALFMAGLAVGSLGMNGRLARMHPGARASDGLACRQTTNARRRGLAGVALILAGLAALMPLMLGQLPVAREGRIWEAVFELAIPALTFLIAMLVGWEFPLANSLATKPGKEFASRLYTADFVGAALGAWLASTWLIPWLGVGPVCWLTAAMNAGAAVVLWRGSEGEG